ncbi:MAG: type II toxin-antitoxin system HipA family toxin [Streptosporangiaceae bacterium]
MTTSDRSAPTRVFVWIWLPGATGPVVCGRLDEVTPDYHTFTYGRSYLARPDAVPLYLPELPLGTGPIRPLGSLSVAGCLRDAGPDAWGQRVILARRVGHLDAASDTGDLSLLTYLLESSGSDRVGALDFQDSPTAYAAARNRTATLALLQDASRMLEEGRPLPEPLAEALTRGTSIGGARPKALLEDHGRHVIAKFSSTADVRPVVKAEAVGMDLARRVGLDVAGSELVSCAGRDVLLVERFDRTTVPGQRRLLVSALTILGLDEFLGARHGSYAELAEQIRARFTDPDETLRELFARIVFNVCISNTDDHPRNHAAFWDGAQLTLSPAYDLCPQPRSGETAAQAMAIGSNGERDSTLTTCRAAAAVYHLSTAQAQDIIDAQVSAIGEQWTDAAEECALTHAERDQLWQRQILNRGIFY